MYIAVKNPDEVAINAKFLNVSSGILKRQVGALL
jgi:hypothetical protein